MQNVALTCDLQVPPGHVLCVVAGSRVEKGVVVDVSTQQKVIAGNITLTLKLYLCDGT